MKTRTEIFWDIYINHKDILEIYDEIYEFFLEEIPEKDMEYYDFTEVVLENFGHHESEGKHQKAVNFIHLVESKNPKLYQELYSYADEYLISYYCFDNQMEKASKAFLNFIKTPEQDFEHYLASFKRLLYYGHHEILDKAIVENYEQIRTSDELINEPARDLAFTKLYFTLEQLYKKNPNKFDKEEFIKIKPYGFGDSEDFLLLLENGFKQDISDIDCVVEFIKDRYSFMVSLQIYFLKFMYQRGFPFAISGTIWEKMNIFWEENKTKNICAPNDFFPIKPNEFKEYLSNFSNLMNDNSADMVALIWGMPHIFEFLQSIDLISQRTFDKAIALSGLTKAKAIVDNTSWFWTYGFIHTWAKPASVSDIEFEQETKIVKKALHFENLMFPKLAGEISEELDLLGDFGKLIRSEAKRYEKRFNTVRESIDFAGLADALTPRHSKEKNSKNIEETDRIIKDVRTESKTGRNSPCPCGSGKKYKKCCA